MRREWNEAGITDNQQHVAMLRILLATAMTALDAFDAADNPIDAEFVIELRRITERTRGELERLTAAPTGG